MLTGEVECTSRLMARNILATQSVNRCKQCLYLLRIRAAQVNKGVPLSLRSHCKPVSCTDIHAWQ